MNMVIGGCEELAPTFTSAEQLEEKIGKIRQELKALLGNKPLKSGSLVWVASAKEKIDEAFCLLKIREQYPELQEVFAEFEQLAHDADDDLYKYGTKMKHPDYVPGA